MSDSQSANASTAGNLSPSERLIADLKVVAADAQELLTLTAGQTGEKAAELRLRLQERLDRANAEVRRLQEAAWERARDAGKAADHFVHDRPWTAVGIAAGVGLVIGLLANRR